MRNRERLGIPSVLQRNALLVGLFSLLFLLISPTVLQAQTQWEEDVLYLKNGSLLRGTHIRTGTVDSISFQLRDGQVLRFAQEEVETLQREATRHHRIRAKYNSSWRPPYVFEPGFFRRIGYGLAIGSNGSFPTAAPYVEMVLGYRFFPQLEAGIGTGFHAYADGLIIPAYLEVNGPLLKRPVTPVIQVQGGYGFSMISDWRSEEFQGGSMMQAGAGLRVRMRTGKQLQAIVGYREQPSYVAYTDFVWDPVTGQQLEFDVAGFRTYRRITLQIAMMF